MPPSPWGVTTRRDDVVFVHLLDWSSPVLALSGVDGVASARLLRNGEPVDFEILEDAVVLRLPERPLELIDEVVVLDVSG